MSPIFREIRFYNVVVPEAIADEVIRNICGGTFLERIKWWLCRHLGVHCKTVQPVMEQVKARLLKRIRDPRENTTGREAL